MARFNTSAEYTLDENRDLKDAFPDLVYDGGLEIKPLHKGSHSPLPHTMGSPVHFSLPGGDAYDISSGVVMGLPVPNESEFYNFCNGKLDVYYLRKHLGLRPNLNAFVEADLPSECALASDKALPPSEEPLTPPTSENGTDSMLKPQESARRTCRKICSNR